jgi:hypothetical protein
MVRKCPYVIPLSAIVVGIATAQSAEPATLTLACEGTATFMNKDHPSSETSISMGIIVNFVDRTVQGFGDPGEFEVIKIISLSDVKVGFIGGHNPGHQIYGSIDRVTGVVEATSEWVDTENRPTSHTW